MTKGLIVYKDSSCINNQERSWNRFSTCLLGSRPLVTAPHWMGTGRGVFQTWRLYKCQKLLTRVENLYVSSCKNSLIVSLKTLIVLNNRDCNS